MIKILKYDEFNESYGISNWIKNEAINIYNHLLSINGDENTIEDTFNIYTRNYNLINLRISFLKNDKTSGLFDSRLCFIKNNDLFNAQIIIKNNDLDAKIIQIISHELTHINEFYFINILNKNLPKYFKIKNFLSSLNNNKNISEDYNKFIHILYLTLDNEMNARIAELYHYLIDYDYKTHQEYYDIINLHYTGKSINFINSFNSIEFVNNCINTIGVNGLITSSLNLLNTLKNNNIVLNGSKYNFVENLKIENKDDLYKFYKKFEKMFKNKLIKHNNKINNMIKRIIIEKNKLY